MEKLSGLCVLLAALSLAVAGDKVTLANFTDGDNLTLNVRPSYSEPIINIVWKFNGDLVADWVKDKVPLELYGTFKLRTELDTGNARLVIRSTSKADTGKYTVEINNYVHGESYDARWIKELNETNKPKVVVRTLTCTHDSERCDVSCVADTSEAEPVTYSWKFGEKEWKVSEKDMVINKIDNVHDKTITCRISNPVSENVVSEPIENPLYYYNTGPYWWLLVPLLVLCGCGGAFFMWKRRICPFNPNPNKLDAPTSPPGGPTDAELAERETLKEEP